MFTAGREEIREIVLSEHEAKMEGLARHVLSKPTKEARRKWLDEFEVKHGYELTLELKRRVVEINRERLNTTKQLGVEACPNHPSE